MSCVRRFLLPLAPLLAALLSCSQDPSTAEGNSASEAGNALALIRNPDGTPAAGVALELHPDTLLPDTLPSPPVWSGSTDASGRASIAVPVGRWSLVGRSGSLLFRGFVRPGDTLRDTVRAGARLRGSVPGARWLLFPGLGRAARCASDGSFDVDGLPSGLLQLGIATSGGVTRRLAWVPPSATLVLSDTGASEWIGEPPTDSFALDLGAVAAGVDSLVGSWSVPAASPFWELPFPGSPRISILDTTGTALPARVQGWDPTRHAGRVDFLLPKGAAGTKLRLRAALTDSVSNLPAWFPGRVSPLPASPGTAILPDTGWFLLLGAVELPPAGGRSNVLNWVKPGAILDSGAWIDWNPADSTVTATLGDDAFDGQTWRMAPGRHTFALRWDSAGILLLFDEKSLIATNAAASPSRDRRSWSSPVLGGGGVASMDVAARPADTPLDWIVAITRSWK